jgi:predicted MPP superfamily phosphohydrolase
MPPDWTPGLSLRVAVLSDLHCGGVHMPLSRLSEIVDITNALDVDVVLLLGDYVVRASRNTHDVTVNQWTNALARLRAPLGVHAILGNHEYWDDPAAQRNRGREPIFSAAIREKGINLLVNQAIRLERNGMPFWLAGLDDQIAYWVGRNRFIGRHDLARTLASVTDDAPVVLMAHEPDIFVDVPDRVSLTLSGHTHGGQVRVLGWSPHVPSNYGNRFAYGHVVEDGRNLVVSAGLGTSVLPVRVGMPPEIVLLQLG